MVCSVYFALAFVIAPLTEPFFLLHNFSFIVLNYNECKSTNMLPALFKWEMKCVHGLPYDKQELMLDIYLHTQFVSIW